MIKFTTSLPITAPMFPLINADLIVRKTGDMPEQP
jgi:hypothetical protein